MYVLLNVHTYMCVWVGVACTHIKVACAYVHECLVRVHSVYTNYSDNYIILTSTNGNANPSRNIFEATMRQTPIAFRKSSARTPELIYRDFLSPENII